MQALLPAARLQLARGDIDLARAVVARGLRAVADDRPRAAELLAILVDVELAAGRIAAAEAAATELAARAAPLDLPTLHARRGGPRRVLADRGDGAGPSLPLEAVVDLRPPAAPVATSAAAAERGPPAGAGRRSGEPPLDAKAAAAILASPRRRAVLLRCALLERLVGGAGEPVRPVRLATLSARTAVVGGVL
jgi:hypothetical protein